MSEGSPRGSIQLEDAEVLEHQRHAGNQYTLRLRAPRAALRAEPGTFAHITCDPSVPLRRPLSIMRANPSEGWLEFLYKPLGAGLAKLAGRRPGDRVSMLAPIGRGFTPRPDRPRVVAIGGGVGIPPMIFAAERLRADPTFAPPLVLMGSELPFPFETCRSELEVPGMPAVASDGMRLLEAWAVPSRLASNAGFAGAYVGHVPALAAAWLESPAAPPLDEVQLLACGPLPMLRAAAHLARRLGLPCQVALEEYMACGVGGCAGCTVLVATPSGEAMKRVCVDGPVFEAADVFSRS